MDRGQRERLARNPGDGCPPWQRRQSREGNRHSTAPEVRGRNVSNGSLFALSAPLNLTGAAIQVASVGH